MYSCTESVGELEETSYFSVRRLSWWEIWQKLNHQYTQICTRSVYLAQSESLLQDRFVRSFLSWRPSLLSAFGVGKYLTNRMMIIYSDKNVLSSTFVSAAIRLLFDRF